MNHRFTKRFVFLFACFLAILLLQISHIIAKGKIETEVIHRNDRALNNNLYQPLNNNFPEAILIWEEEILSAAVDYGIDPNLIATVILIESSGNHSAYSSSGAVGLMQVMPNDGIAETFICSGGPCFSGRPTTEELMDPNFNIRYGCKLLAQLTNQHNSLREALKFYGPYDVDYAYADQVIKAYQSYSV